MKGASENMGPEAIVTHALPVELGLNPVRQALITHALPLQVVPVAFASLGQATHALPHMRLGALQLHAKLPGLLVHCPAPQPPLLLAHSSMSTHAVLVPLRLNPAAQLCTTHAVPSQPTLAMLSPVGHVTQTLLQLRVPAAHTQLLACVLHI